MMALGAPLPLARDAISATHRSALAPADQPQEQYAWVRHQPGECRQAQKFAAIRWKQEGDLLWRYAYRACRVGNTDTPRAVFERHRLKGGKEQAFSEVLTGLDLHHPHCKELIANQAFYAVAMLAYNVMISLKVLELPDDAQSWRIPTLIRYLLTVPVSLSTHARYQVARICVPAGWLRWWRLFVDQWVPERKPGRPAVEEVDSA
jgi:hypothetical protein